MLAGLHGQFASLFDGHPRSCSLAGCQSCATHAGLLRAAGSARASSDVVNAWRRLQEDVQPVPFLPSTVTLSTCTGAMTATATPRRQCEGSCSRAVISLTAAGLLQLSVSCMQVHNCQASDQQGGCSWVQTWTAPVCNTLHALAANTICAEHAHHFSYSAATLSPVCAVSSRLLTGQGM